VSDDDLRLDNGPLENRSGQGGRVREPITASKVAPDPGIELRATEGSYEFPSGVPIELAAYTAPP
jgi:hypothetical protein